MWSLKRSPSPARSVTWPSTPISRTGSLRALGRNGAARSLVGRWNAPSGSDPAQQLTDGMESAFEHLGIWERNPQVLLARFWIALHESQPVVPGRRERDARRRR